jgi:hypothetical protein
MNKTLFKYLIKRTYPGIIISFFIMLIFYILPLATIIVNSTTLYGNDNTLYSKYTNYSDTCLYLLTIVILIFAYFIPILVRGLVLKKAKCDVYLSLPIKKSKLYITTSLFGYLAIISTWSLAFLIGIVISLSKGLPVNYLYYLFYALTMYLLSFAAYATSSLLVSLANNELDAWLITILGILISLFIDQSIMNLFYSSKISFYVNGSPILAANILTTYFEKAAIIYPTDVYNYFMSLDIYLPKFGYQEIFSYVIPTLTICIASPLAYLQTMKFKAENAGQLSEYNYSYRLILPLFLLCLLYVQDISNYFSIDSLLTLSIFIAYSSIVYFVLYFIAKRKIKFDLVMVLTYFITLGLALGLSYLS